MRVIGGLACHFRSAFRLQKHNYLSGFAKRPNHLIENKFSFTYKHIYNAGVYRYPCHSFMVSRTLCVDAKKEDVSGGGPLVEYERRIAAGELFDGDSYQAYMALNDIDAVVESFKKTLELEPNDGMVPVPMQCIEGRFAEQQVPESNPVLEAFGNAKTVRNNNSSSEAYYPRH